MIYVERFLMIAWFHACWCGIEPGVSTGRGDGGPSPRPSRLQRKSHQTFYFSDFFDIDILFHWHLKSYNIFSLRNLVAWGVHLNLIINSMPISTRGDKICELCLCLWEHNCIFFAIFSHTIAPREFSLCL